MKLTQKTVERILELQKEYPEKRSALISALHLSQAEIGYLPREIQNEIAALFEIDGNEVNAVVSFYDMFYEYPIGKHLLHVCKNLSCMLRGSDQIVNKICTRLNISLGETSKDQEFTLIASECLGACDLAPMMLVDEKVIGPIKEEELEEILENAKKSPGHPCPVEWENAHE